MENTSTKFTIIKTNILVALLVILTLFVIVSPGRSSVYADTLDIPEIAPDLNSDGEAYLELLCNNVEYGDYLHLYYAFTQKLDADMKPEDIRMLFWNEPQTEYTLAAGSHIFEASPRRTDLTIKMNGTSYNGCVTIASHGIPAREIGDTVYARAYITDSDGNVYYSDVSKYSVLQYVYSRFEDKELGYNVTDNQMTLYNSVLRYGGAAQLVLNYKEDRLANGHYVMLRVSGGVFSDGFNYGVYTIGDEVWLYAPKECENGVFSDWVDSEGNVVATANLFKLTVDENTKATTFTPNYRNSVEVFVEGGKLSDGSDYASVNFGTAVTVTAHSYANKSFGYWTLNGEKVSTDSTYSFAADNVTLESYKLVAHFYDGVGAHFEDVSSIGPVSSHLVTGGHTVKYSPTNKEGISVRVEADPTDAANKVLRAEKNISGDGAGLNLIFTADHVGDTTASSYEYGVFSADIMFESTLSSVPMQINIGSGYRLQISVSGTEMYLYDANTKSRTNFLGGIFYRGEWVNIKVLYKPGEIVVNETTKEVESIGFKAYVFFNGKLVAESQNPKTWTTDSATGVSYPNHSNKFEDTRLYSLYPEEGSYYVDNVLCYTTNEDLTPAESAKIKVGIPTDEAMWENRFATVYALYGDDADDVIAALSEITELFGEEIYEWIAGLYDPETGAFYYSNSARDTIGYLPDIESTSQAMSLLNSLGLGSSKKDKLTTAQQAKLFSWAQLMQSNRDGYFYHPQWGTDIGASRQGRDLGNFNTIVTDLGKYLFGEYFADKDGFLFDNAQYRLSGGKSGYKGLAPVISAAESVSYEAILPASISTSSVAAVSKLLLTSSVRATALNPTELNKFESPEMWKAYLDWKWEGMNHNTYSFGNYIGSQNSQILARGEEYVKVTEEWFNALQESVQVSLISKGKEPNGIFDEEVNYRSISALLKISGIYSGLDIEYKYPVEAINSALSMMARKLDDPIPEDAVEPNAFNISGNGIVYVYNPPCAIRNLLSNLAENNTSPDAATLRKQAVELIRSSAAELITVTAEKLALFRKTDGSYSYLVNKSSSSSQGEPAAVPDTNEGDVNGTGLAIGTRSALLGILGISMDILPSYSGATTVDGKDATHLERFKALISAKTESALKGQAKDLVYDFEGAEPTIPSKSGAASTSVVSESGGSRLLFTDTSTTGGARLNFTSTFKEVAGESCYVGSIDLKYNSGSHSQVNHQLGFSNHISLNLTLNTTTNKVTFVSRYYDMDMGAGTAKETSQSISGSVNSNDWFTLKLTVYPDRTETENGYAKLEIIQGGKTVSTTDLRARFNNSGDLDTYFTIYGLSATAASIYVDNVSAVMSSSYEHNGWYDFDISNTRPTEVTAGEIVSEHDNHLKLGAGVSTELLAGVEGGAYDFNELFADIRLDGTSSSDSTVDLKDSSGNSIVKLVLARESDGTVTVKESSTGKTLLSGVGADDWFTLKLQYYSDTKKLDVMARYVGADGLYKTSAATLTGYTSAGDASDLSSVVFNFASAASLNNVYIRNVTD